jgi:Flp pilus assembly protein TadG
MKLRTRFSINKHKISVGGISDQIRQFWSSTAGVAATEFALVAPIFIVLTLGVIDVGTAVFERFELKTAARVGAEYALTKLTDVDDITDAVVRATNHKR